MQQIERVGVIALLLLVVTMATVAGKEQRTTMGDLLPGAFGAAHMQG